MKTNRKVYYLNYGEYQVPMIRLAGKLDRINNSRVESNQLELFEL